MRARAEAFGAWVQLDDATLVALDRDAAQRLGIEGGTRWREGAAADPSAALEAHVAVTGKCPVACAGCYQHASPEGAHVPHDALLATLDALAAAGVFTVAFGGGEPLTRDDLPQLASAARARGLAPVVTTSGLGINAARAHALSVFAQVNVSHDGVDGAYRAVRGFDGAAVADRAIRTLVAAGVPVGVNLVLTRQSFDHVRATADHVRALGARELQLLRYKPAGRAASADYLARRLAPAQARELYPLLEELVARHGAELSVRIDCALVPFLSPYVTDAQSLARWGVFGCEAGRHLAAVTRDGALAPCSFDHGGAADGTFAQAWAQGAGVRAHRDFVASPPEPCASCAIRSVCRGGCKVVSRHLAGGFVADPECPRVRATRSTS